MNEELQSMNDELQFSNESLRDRQEELDRLNDFMSSVLGSMNSGVAVVDADMRILAWNSRAEDLWGVRADEAIGRHLLNLDIGLPLESLRPTIRAQLSEEPPEPATSTLDAVNRRGRALQVRVTITHLIDQRTTSPAAMLVMDVVEDDSSAS
jgi:two-component system, chemotaxis family, CheB/CheR fusion protein